MDTPNESNATPSRVLQEPLVVSVVPVVLVAVSLHFNYFTMPLQELRDHARSLDERPAPGTSGTSVTRAEDARAVLYERGLVGEILAYREHCSRHREQIVLGLE